MEYFNEEKQLITNHKNDGKDHRPISPPRHHGYELMHCPRQELGIQRQIQEFSPFGYKEWDQTEISEPIPDQEQQCYYQERYQQDSDI